MRRIKVLLIASLLGTGPTFGQQYLEPPEPTNEELISLNEEEEMMLEEERLAAEEGADVIYIYPMEA
jgi:hypothetical protein